MGGYFTKWLLKGGKHTVTAITRKESKAQFPAGVRVKSYVPDDHDSLVAAVRDQQFLIIILAVGISQPGVTSPEIAIIRAAADAGVPYVMPNAYGPNPINEALMKQILIGLPFFEAKKEIETLGKSKWVALSCGYWFEWSFVGNGAHRFGCDFAKRTMTFFDDGEEKITTSTWDQCGRALAAYLSLPLFPQDENDKTPAVDNWANRPIYIKSFHVNQKDMFEVAKRVTGTTDADWTVEHEDSQERFARAQKGMQDPATRIQSFSTQMYTRIFFPTGEGDYTKLDLANDKLGLPEEDIDESTKEGMRLLEEGKLTYY